MSKNQDLILVFSGLDKEDKKSILNKVPNLVKDNKVNFKSFNFMDEVALFSHIKNDLAGEYNQNNQEVINDNELFLKSCDLYNEIDESGDKDSYVSILYENGTESLENNDEYSNIIKDFFNSECKKVLEEDEEDE